MTDPSYSTEDARLTKYPFDHPSADGRYGYGSDLHKRAAELVSVEDLNMPGPEFLESIDWTNQDQALLELRRSYAGGWATGEHIASELIFDWLIRRHSPITRQTLEQIANGEDPVNADEKFKGNWYRFNCAAELARLILALPKSG